VTPRLSLRWRRPQRGDNLPLPAGPVPDLSSVAVAPIPGPAHGGAAQVYIARMAGPNGEVRPMALSIYLPGAVLVLHRPLSTYSPLIARLSAAVIVGAYLKTLDPLPERAGDSVQRETFHGFDEVGEVANG